MEATGSRARLEVNGSGEANIATGIAALDHLLIVLARYARFDLALEVAPAAGEAEIAGAAGALGAALWDPLRAPGVRGYAASTLPADEALAHIALEVSDRPRVVSNVDLSDARIGGAGSDVVAAFLRSLADSAGLNLHVRLIEGEDPQHVLDAIFKTLGVALAEACRAPTREERENNHG